MKTKYRGVLGALLLLGLIGAGANVALADGTETLGTPSITIASGTGVIAAGVGLAPGTSGAPTTETLTVEVPPGATVKQVLLYWEGQMIGDLAGPGEILVNGSSVTGTRIGGQSFFFNLAGQRIYSSAYRADITGLGAVVAGTNSLAITSPGYTEVSNGAGVLIVYDAGSGPASIGVRDGLDLAFANFPEPRKSTVAQTFTFPAATSDRVGNLSMFFGSVAGAISGFGADRPNSIEITVAGVTTSLANPLASNDGDEWDTFNFPVSIPAGATSLRVQAISINPLDPANTSDPLPASFAWTAAALSVPPVSTGAIGDTAWFDVNKDGIQNFDPTLGPVEPGVADVTVNLLLNPDGDTACSSGDETVFGTDITDPAGKYLFDGLGAGNYCVEFVRPEGFAFTTRHAPGSTPTNDSDADPVYGLTGNIALGANETDLSWDAGLVLSSAATVGDFVWEDCNGNGIQDDAGIQGCVNGGGISGVVVELREPDTNGACSSSGQLVQVTSTGSAGDYLFTNLPAGSYCVTFPADPGAALACPAGSMASYTTKGAPTSTTTTDSNANPDGTTDAIDVLAGDIDRTIDAGLFCSVSIGDTLWNDLNRDGIQDDLNGSGGEPGINDIGVTLLDCEGNQVGSATSTAPAPNDAAFPQVAGGAGWYRFEGLAPGCYVVQFDTPTGFVFSDAEQGTDPQTDSNADPTGASEQISLISGDSDRSVDAGVNRPATAGLGDFVFEDTNGNGIQDAGEIGIPDVPVALLTPGPDGNCGTSDDVVSASTFTDLTGKYEFKDLSAGAYCVAFDKSVVDCASDGVDLGDPAFSPQGKGDPAKDSDPDPATGVAGKVVLSSGAFDPTIDAGIYCPAKLGDRVFKDCNGNGIQDDEGLPGCETQVGVPGVEVKLFDCEGNPITDENGIQQTRTTDADGFYMFGGEPGLFDLAPGSYVARFDKTSFPAGFTFSPSGEGNDDATDSDCVPPGGDTACTILPSGGVNLNRDCGLVPPAPNCNLLLDKQCRVEATAPSGDLECEAKIAATVLRYIGEGVPTDVIVTGTNKKATVQSSFDGEKLTIDARPQDLGAKMTITADGVAETIHTSCSVPYVAGLPAPLDSPKGAPSARWSVVSFVDKEGRSVAVPDDNGGPFADSCSFQQRQVSCETVGKPSRFTFRYLGDGPVSDCTENAASRAGQKPPTCSGSLSEGATVMLSVNKGVLSKATVGPGETFELSGFGSDTEITLQGGGGSELDAFHTSCSAPLETGDIFGNLQLLAFDDQRSGATVTYRYRVENAGDPVSDIKVTDNLLGAIGIIPALPAADGSKSAILQAVTEISETTTNVATATGTLANGQTCAAQPDSVTVEAATPTCEVSIELDKVEDSKIKWKLNSLNGVDATIDRVTLTWPGNGKLKKVKFDGSDILKNVLLKSPAMVDTWLKASKDRTLEAGDSGKNLEFELSAKFPKKKNQPLGDFNLEVTFEQGCSVTF